MLESEVGELLDELLKPDPYPHETSERRLLETHISWVILTGKYAYKLKKPLRNDFLDYGSLERRRKACYEELRINRRWSPDLYLSVAKIVSTSNGIKVVEDSTIIDGRIIEYSVQMVQFPEGTLASDLIRDGAFTVKHAEMLGDELASAHQQAPVVASDMPWGRVEQIVEDAYGNLQELRKSVGSRFEEPLQMLEDWMKRSVERLREKWNSRRVQGAIRECHGDLHLGNLVWLNHRMAIFDGIEFNEGFRWIDPINDLAFLLMDLSHRKREDLAGRLLNRYLEQTGDFAGVPLIDWYSVYRALVRAKVAAIRANQEMDPRRADDDWLLAEEYVEWAVRRIAPHSKGLAITCGLSGSGKSTGTETLLDTGRVIRVRSDLERKRIAGIESTTHAPTAHNAGIYRREFTVATYMALLLHASEILEGGFWAILDATFLEWEFRSWANRIAKEWSVPFVILHFEAKEAELRERIERRNRLGLDVSDATIDVVEEQRRSMQPLTEAELLHVSDIPSLSQWIHPPRS